MCKEKGKSKLHLHANLIPKRLLCFVFILPEFFKLSYYYIRILIFPIVIESYHIPLQILFFFHLIPVAMFRSLVFEWQFKIQYY